MKRSLHDKWIAALQTSKKASRCMRDGDKRCCLGVLCDLIPEVTVAQDKVFSWELNEEIVAYEYKGHKSGIGLPGDLAEELRFESSTGQSSVGPSLATLNDGPLVGSPAGYVIGGRMIDVPENGLSHVAIAQLLKDNEGVWYEIEED